MVLSGPNEGPNVGSVNTYSGTVGNTQLALDRGIPAIALSADINTMDDAGLANPNSKIVAGLTVKLLASLEAQKGSGALLAKGVALNVNFPKGVAANTGFAFSRVGTYNAYDLAFRVANGTYGMGVVVNSSKPTAAQMEDESVVVASEVSVSAMQFGFEQHPAAQEWLRLRMQPLKGQ
ncbi:5'/3'-nucleotidase SurE [bioreactor metagenome]|uniref:5'/3'-nucleotidase SurE n=1 Tax=bioreactor metagenome TaxID=1076179 RepID=A0A645D3J2_9ZZZZ